MYYDFIFNLILLDDEKFQRNILFINNFIILQGFFTFINKKHK